MLIHQKMLTPSILNSNFVDNFFNSSFDRVFDDMFRMPFGRTVVNTMSTDVQDLGDSYQMEIELPGFNKEDIKADLKDGYLTISAMRNTEDEKQDENGKYVRRERYMGKCQRSFYVGDSLSKEDIKANFENGVLKLMVPKKETQAVEEKQYIAIE